MADRGSHARHDRFAIAATIGRGVAPTSVGMCPSCGALHADLRAIRAALRVAWTPPRHRDLRLTPSDGARLRPTRWWRWSADMIGTRRDTVTKPLALSFAGLGLAGLLLTAVPLDTPGAPGPEVSAPSDMPAVSVAGEPGLAALPDTPRAATIGDEPLAILSIGLLGAGGVLAGLRRRAGRARAMR